MDIEISQNQQNNVLVKRFSAACGKQLWKSCGNCDIGTAMVLQALSEFSERIRRLERNAGSSGRVNGYVIWCCVYCGRQMRTRLTYRTSELWCSGSTCRRRTNGIVLDRYPMVNTVNSVVNSVDHPVQECSQSDTAPVAAPDSAMDAAPIGSAPRLSKG